MCPVSEVLLPPVTPFPQVNILPDSGMTEPNLKCCTVPNSALIQFRVSPVPADGICAQNVPAPRTVTHLVPRTAEGLESGSTADGDSAALSFTGESCSSRQWPAQCRSVHHKRQWTDCGTTKHCRSDRTAILQCGTLNCIHFICNVKELHASGSRAAPPSPHTQTET